MTDAFGPFMPVVFALLFETPVLLVTHRLPRRNHFWLRGAICLAVLFVFNSLVTPTANLASPDPLETGEFLSMALFFVITLTVMALIALFCHRVSITDACFAAVAGYTLENFGAGLAALFDLLVTHGTASVSIEHMVVACLVVYACFWWFIVRNSSPVSQAIELGPISVVLFFTVFLVNIVFDMGVKRMPGLGMPFNYCVLFRVTEIVMCAALLGYEFELLYRRQIEIEMATAKRLAQAREAQYELSRDTIDAVNVRMHDIRHQIRHLEDGSEGTTVLDKDVLRDIAREVSLYDAAVKTGNDALDTILTEKALLGSREGISLACIADGSSLAFMAPSDLYALFGNALENAFEAVRLLNDPEKRNISLLIRRVANMASIHIENYFEGEITYDSYGNLMSSKMDKESHGYGVRSMRQIVEKYGGTMTISVDEQTFAVNMLIPIP